MQKNRDEDHIEQEETTDGKGGEKWEGTAKTAAGGKKAEKERKQSTEARASGKNAEKDHKEPRTAACRKAKTKG